MRTIITPIACCCFLFSNAQNIALDGTFGFEGHTFVENTSQIDRIVQNTNGDIFSTGKTITGANFHLTLTKHDAFGTLDPSFGTNGITYTNIDRAEDPLDIQLQADGKILVAGFVHLPPSGNTYDFNAFIARYLPNGIIDSSFATNGIFRQNISESEFRSIIIQNDQSLLLIGNQQLLTAITKLTSNGTIDNSFGTNGIKMIGDYSTYPFINGSGIHLNDGSILLYGFDGTDINGKAGCAKIDSQGNFITSFGQGGKATFDTDTDPNVLEILSRAQELPDGKIVLAAQVTDNVIIKLKPDGTLDSTFATHGILHHSLPFRDMLVHPNGKILIGGSVEISQFNYGLSISRFNSNGTIDPGFNSTGTFELDLSERNDALFCMQLADADHLLTGGASRVIDLNSNFSLARIDIGQTLGVSKNTSGDISIYPNPFNDELHISTNMDNIREIHFADAFGRLIKKYPANTHTLSLEEFTSGLYHIIFVTTEETFSRKLMKQ